MVQIVLFHSILGLRPAERRIAAHLGAAGHPVHLPDLYGGQSAEDYPAGFALKDRVGEAAILARARAALAPLPAETVLAGVSFGAFLLGGLIAERPRTAGLLLYAGILPWPAAPRPGLPVSAHVARPDPFDDEAYFAEWQAGSAPAAIALHRYDGAGHYFLDESLPDHDAAAADLCLARSVAFLNGL